MRAQLLLLLLDRLLLRSAESAARGYAPEQQRAIVTWHSAGERCLREAREMAARHRWSAARTLYEGALEAFAAARALAADAHADTTKIDALADLDAASREFLAKDEPSLAAMSFLRTWRAVEALDRAAAVLRANVHPRSLAGVRRARVVRAGVAVAAVVLVAWIVVTFATHPLPKVDVNPPGWP